MRRRDCLTAHGARGEPAPARFLELALPVRDIQASIAFYTKLGFSLADVGETRRHPYAVATDGRVCIGLHELDGLPASLTFVQPGLLAQLDRFERLAPGFDVRELGNDVFNELGWRDPGGNSIRFVEARTFSPSKRPASQRSLCGYFHEIGLPAADPAASKAHWEELGFVGIDDDGGIGPHVCCTSDTVDIGLYDPARLGRPTLIFEVEDLAAAAGAIAAAAGAIATAGALRAAGASGDAAPTLALAAPEGTPILILAAN